MSSAEAKKLVVVVLDGLRYDAARKYLGYMEHLVEQGRLPVIKCSRSFRACRARSTKCC